VKKNVLLNRLLPVDHEATAQLLHRSLVHWYQTHLNLGARYGTSHEPFLLFPQVYEALDPGQAIAARDAERKELLGVCFVHPRETHVSVGIVAIAPDAAAHGVARAMMEQAVELARSSHKPLRLVSSLLNLDSFSLYSRLGFVPHTMYQDMTVEVPAAGLAAHMPPGADRVREARPDEAARLADFEWELQGIRREQDYAFFLRNDVGSWKVWVLESAAGLDGFLVASHHPTFGMFGPGVARDAETAEALLWRALDARRGQSPLFLVQCSATDLIHTLYGWGARNAELHVAQARGPFPEARGIAFPTFLPESA